MPTREEKLATAKARHGKPFILEQRVVRRQTSPSTLLQQLSALSGSGHKSFSRIKAVA